MQKIWTIARREYSAMVATKAFLISIILMPVLGFGGVVVANLLRNVRDTSDKVVVIVDGSGGALFGDLEAAVAAHNALLEQIAAAADKQSPSASASSSSAPTTPAASAATTSPAANPVAGLAGLPKYHLERHETDTLSDADRLALSDRIRQSQILAFVEIPGEVLADPAAGPPAEVRFYAQNVMLSPDRQWFDRRINDAVTTRRLGTMQIDPLAVRRATLPVRVTPLGLVKQSADGQIRGADASTNALAIFLPLGFMMLMFMLILLAAQPLIESVMEEKSGKIAEVLLGSVNTFQLMFGKLLGNVAGSLSVVAIYGVGGILLAFYNGWTHYLPMQMLPWFLAFQVFGVLMYSSLFMAVGASVSQLKEAQAMLMPVWLLLSSPMFVWMSVIREPNGSLATWLSFFPPATPMLMIVRLASDAVIPAWQPVAGLLLLAATALVILFLAARIFRIGILWQGKTPKFSELARWALRG